MGNFTKLLLALGVFCFFLFAGLLGGIGQRPDTSEATDNAPRTYKDKLVPDRVLDVARADHDGLIGIMVGTGTDGEHFVSLAVPRRDIREGLHTGINSNVVTAYNGKDHRYAHSPKKYGTTIDLTINSLSQEKRTAVITVSGRLIADMPGGGPYLEIVPVALQVQGEQFDNLVAKTAQRL